MKAAIIAYGENVDGEEIIAKIKSSDYIICADGGGQWAYENGIIPNYLIGDFDSVSQKILNFFSTRGVEIIRYSREKDYTDTEICVYKALELGCMEISIIAGVGSRIDHSLGNIGLLHLIKQRGRIGNIISRDCIIYLCSDRIELKGSIGDIVSILPFFGDAYGVKSKGLKYQLNDTDMAFGRPIGISNEMTENICSIEIKKGEILVIKQKNI